MYEVKTEDSYEYFTDDQEMFDFSNYLTKSKYYDNSSKLVVSKMKDETNGVVIKEFLGWKPKMYSYLLDDNSKHKKAKSVNRNVVTTISHNDYKDVLLNKECLRHSIDRIQNRDHKIKAYEIKKISLSWFDNKICIQNNGCDGLPLAY